MITLKTELPDLQLVEPDIERDAPISLQWLAGDAGRNTLKLMGNTDEDNKPSTLEAEKDRVKDFIDSVDQLNWMISYGGEIIGSVWVDLEPSEYLAAPSVHIMIGNPSARGHGIGGATIKAVIHYLQTQNYDTLYSRHLTYNQQATHLLQDVGFVDQGGTYADSDGLEWQNVTLDLS